MPDASITAIGRIQIKGRESTGKWDRWSSCRQMAERIKNDPRIPEDRKTAALRGLNELFFPTRHSTNQEIEEAKKICMQCAVRIDCLAHSCVHWEKVGIWGGQTETERRETRREMRAKGVCDDMNVAISWLDNRYGKG